MNLIGVMLAGVMLGIAGFALLEALNTSFRGSRTAEPKAIGQITVSNLQTDLNALSMYDPTVLSKLTTSQTINVAHSAAATGSTLPPSDTQPTKITVQQVTGSGSNGQLVVNYAVPSDSNGAVAVTGNSTITLVQRAPNGCDVNLKTYNQTKPAGNATIYAPDGTPC